MTDKRKFHRISFQCECKISCGDMEWTGELLDISLRGALFQLQKTAKLEPSANCYLDIILADGDIHLQFEAELVHREDELYGFLFLSEDLETLTHLRRLLELNIGGDDLTRQEIASWLGG